MKKRIHINQHNVKSNKKLLKAGAMADELKPVITCKTYKSNDYGHEVLIHGDSKVIYSPDKPLSCGATVWIETDALVTLKFYEK